MLVDLDIKLIYDIKNTNKTFGEMVRVLRDVWVHDMGAKFVETILPDSVEPYQLTLYTGVWRENKQLIAALEKNEVWWSKHFVERTEDGGYEFNL